MRPLKCQRRPGFTLIEWLVVITIIAVLINLMLPIVAAVREAANRMGCIQNLKEIARGLAQYHDMNGSFPLAAKEPNNKFLAATLNASQTRHENWGPTWVVQLLPYIRQGNLYGQFRKDLPTKHPTNQPVTSTVLPGFLCPSDNQGPNVRRNDQQWPFTGQDFGNYFARGNYGINGGTSRSANSSGTNLYRRGLVHLSELWSARYIDVFDGASNTLALTELVVHSSPSDNSQGLWAYPGATYMVAYNDRGGNNAPIPYISASQIATPNCDASKPTASTPNPCTTYTPHCDNVSPYHPVFGCEDGQSAGHVARSRHAPGGVNVAMVDGRVRFIGNNINPSAWLFLFTISGGEIVPDF